MQSRGLLGRQQRLPWCKWQGGACQREVGTPTSDACRGAALPLCPPAPAVLLLCCLRFPSLGARVRGLGSSPPVWCATAATAARARGCGAAANAVCTVEVFAARCTHFRCTQKHAHRLILRVIDATPDRARARPAQPAHASSRLAPQPTRGSASNRWVVTRRGGASRAACRSDVVRYSMQVALPGGGGPPPTTLVTPAD